MSKGLLNIFIIAIACVALTVAPINSSILRLEIKSPQNNSQVNGKNDRVPVFAIVPLIPAGSTLNKPSSLSFEISSGNLMENVDGILGAIQVVLSKDGVPISTQTAKELNAVITQDTKAADTKATDTPANPAAEATEKTNVADNLPGKLKIPLKFSSLNLTSGNYTLDINVTNGSNLSQFSYNIIYIDGKTYSKATPGSPSSYLVYHPEYDLELLLPASYNGMYEYAAARNIKQLIIKNAPDSFKLSKKKAELYNANYILTGNSLKIDFSSKLIAEKSLSGSDNTLQIRGMVETALSNNLINEVILSVDGIEDITILNTKLTTNRYKKSNVKKVYVGLINKSSRLFIFPYSLSEAQTGMDAAAASSKPDALIKLLQNAKLPALNGGGQMINPVPTTVNLLDFKSEGTTLTLNFSSSIMGAFGQDPDYIGLMIDSIVNTMTDAGKYESVIFNVEGKPLEAIGSVKIDRVYKHLKNINPAY